MRSNRTKDQSQARTLRPGAPNSLQPLASKHSSVHSSSSVDVAPLMTASASRADSRSYQDWEDVDKVNEHDPQACSSYARSVFSHLRDAELEKRSRTDYMEVKQGEMNPKMRAILVEWLVEVSEEYKLCADTLYQAVNYLDRFLSVHTVKRPQLQLVGVACLWVASKYEEIYPPTLPDFCYITDNTYSREQLISMEEVILKRLNYQLTVPTAKTFLRRLLQVCNPDEYLHFLSNYLTELSLLDYNMLSFTPSVIAAAGVYLANLMLGRAPWDAQLRHYSAYVPSDIKNGVIALAAVHQAIASSSSLTAVREKYANARFLSVSQMPSIVVTASMFGPN
ncbi:hypothetical protein FOA52_005287 [Chlamydomonas sp. UWO 241]|nr:hypothetical protein FOA52_005287 [Chlamydomonas sp. UWO 241]